MVSKYKTGKGRKADSKGRSKNEGRFLKLEYYLLQSSAWKSLKSVRRAIYIELAQRFNGSNNGEISMSVREAAYGAHCSKDTASEAFHELEGKGFIKRNLCGSFDFKLRHATTWILTQHPYKEQVPTKEFMKWKPEDLIISPKQRTTCPKKGTGGIVSESFNKPTVPFSGPKH